MNDILTIKEHQTIHIKNNRDIYNNILSYEDRELLFDIKFIDNNNQEKYVFSNNGKNKIKSNSIVGSISLKNGLIIEILPKFANNSLAKDTLNKYRKTLVNMIRVSGEQNFLNTKSQSSKISMGEMPLINYIIELFSKELLNILRRGLYQNYSKETNYSTYIKGNILVSKTIQNNIVDKSKIYSSYNKHSSNNLLMQIFKSLILLLRKDSNLSYNTKQNLYEVTLILSDVNNIQLTNKDFEKITFNRLNDKFEILFSQAKFIFSKYMPFSSSINATPFWSILFNMDYLFEKFIAYLLKKSNIEIEEQSTKDVYTNHKYTVTTKPDFLIKQNVDLFTSKTNIVADAKWKILDNNKTLYGLNTQNFWQLFSYMNLIENDEVNGYFIVPKNSNNFEDEIIFNPIRDGNKSISILSIDFSLDFNELIERYKFKVNEGQLKLDIKKKEEVLKEINKETVILKDKILDEIEIKFNFKEFIDELEILSKDTKLTKRFKNFQNQYFRDKFKNIFYISSNISEESAKQFIKYNLKKEKVDLEDMGISAIPRNINKFKNLKELNLKNNNITELSDNIFTSNNIRTLNIAGNYNISLSVKTLFIKELIIDENIISVNKELLDIMDLNIQFKYKTIKYYDKNKELKVYIKEEDTSIEVEKEDINIYIKDLENRFPNIEKEELFKLSQNNTKESLEIRKIIAEETDNLEILNELSKSENDLDILNIIVDKNHNKDFKEKIKDNDNIYSIEIMDRISKYEQYYIKDNYHCLIYKIASSYRLSLETREYLFDKYSDDINILEALNNKSLDYFRLYDLKNKLSDKLKFFNEMEIINENTSLENNINIQINNNLLKQKKITNKKINIKNNNFTLKKAEYLTNTIEKLDSKNNLSTMKEKDKLIKESDKVNEEYYNFALESFNNNDYIDALEYLDESKASIKDIKILREKIYKEIGKPFSDIKNELLEIRNILDREHRTDIRKYLNSSLFKLEKYPSLSFIIEKKDNYNIKKMVYILTYIILYEDLEIGNKFIKDIDVFHEIIQDKLIYTSYEKDKELGRDVLSWCDSETSLIWEVKNIDNINQTYNWLESFEYAKKLNSTKYADYNDWRLPTIEELRTLSSSSSNNGFFIKKQLSTLTKDIYWSSTKYKLDNLDAYAIAFKHQKDHGKQIYKTHSRSVRCVRGKYNKSIN